MASSSLNNINGYENIKDSSIYFEGLTKDSFVLDVRFISFRIIDALGKNIGHYVFDAINSIELVNNRITIHTSSSEAVNYIFISHTDAEIANDKLNNLINGGLY